MDRDKQQKYLFLWAPSPPCHICISHWIETQEALFSDHWHAFLNILCIKRAAFSRSLQILWIILVCSTDFSHTNLLSQFYLLPEKVFVCFTLCLEWIYSELTGKRFLVWVEPLQAVWLLQNFLAVCLSPTSYSPILPDLAWSICISGGLH